MDIFDRLKRFKRAKQVFMSFNDHERARIIAKHSILHEEEAIALCKRDQGRILFSVFYGKGGEQLVECLLAQGDPRVK